MLDTDNGCTSAYTALRDRCSMAGNALRGLEDVKERIRVVEILMISSCTHRVWAKALAPRSCSVGDAGERAVAGGSRPLRGCACRHVIVEIDLNWCQT